MRILLVDDSRVLHTFVGSALREKGWDLVSAFHGKEALDLLEKDVDFSAILLDWEMPVLDGPATLMQIRQLHQSIPVVMLTSKNRPSDIKKMINEGVQDYLFKPLTGDIITEKLAEILEGKA